MPVPPALCLCTAPLQDVEWQADTSSLSASWQAFYSFYGPERYEVCAGTQPYACDVAAAANVTNRTDGAAPAPAVPHPTALQVYAHTFEGLALRHAVPYYVTVTLVDTIGRRTAAASNGVRVDETPALLGVVSDGRAGRELDFTWSAKVFVWWEGFRDPESGVGRYQVARAAPASRALSCLCPGRVKTFPLVGGGGGAFCSDFVVLQSSACFSSVAFNSRIPQRGGGGSPDGQPAAQLGCLRSRRRSPPAAHRP